MKRTIFFAALGALLYTTNAEAVDHTVCLRIPVTIGDTTGQANDIGTSGNWKARGIEMRVLNGVTAAQIVPWTFASASSGCVSFWATNNGPFNIQFRPRGRLAASNELEVRNDANNLPIYSAGSQTFRSGGTHVVVAGSEWILPRMYAILAYAIQDGFRGRFDDEKIVVHWNAGAPCGCDDTSCGNCACSSGGVGHIAVCDWASDNKFLLGHEYGHLNLSLGAGGYTNNCDYGTSSHGMTTLEFDSCAAMEGWAHFVSADIWNGGVHAGGDPVGWFRYWGPSDTINMESGGSGCSNYQRRYAHECECNADCATTSTELDWMRMWWDYHTDDSPGDPGIAPSHHQLHGEIKEGLGWGSTNACSSIRNGVGAESGSAQEDRIVQMLWWNGANTTTCN